LVERCPIRRDCFNGFKGRCSVYHDSNLPDAQWLAETGNVTPADINLVSSMMTGRRIAGQVIVSRRLLIQAAGTVPFDDFIASRLRLVFGSRLDQACLLGGSSPNEPTGIVNTPGCQLVSVASPPVWSDLSQMRFLATNFDINRDSFGWIVTPNGRRYFESTPRFASGSSASIWDLMKTEAEVSLEVTDDQIWRGFCKSL
jgi:hypothetical protein